MVSGYGDEAAASTAAHALDPVPPRSIRAVIAAALCVIDTGGRFRFLATLVAMELQRPGVLRWLWYALGGALPERHSTWVLHDTTTGSWGWRHVARAAVQMAIPVALVLVLVPGPFWIRGMTALGGLLLGLIFSIAYMTETTENRVKKAGYPAGTAQAVRDRVQLSRNADATVKRRVAAEKRAARYRERQGR